MMIEELCRIWNTPAILPRRMDGDSVYFDSPRAGGKYKITGSASSVLGSFDATSKARLTSWLHNQRRAGVEYPAITTEILNAAKSFRPLTTTERIERTLLFFNEAVRIGEVIPIYHNDEFSMDRKEESRLAAVSETSSKGELVAILGLMAKMGLIEDTTKAIGLSYYTPTAQGWLQIDKLVERLPSTTQAFVAMWFNPAMEAAYIQGIEPAITDSGYRAVRIDKKEHNNKIDDEIIAEIRRSKFLVADFTCEKEKVRGGVYFESGFAMGLGLPVFWTVKDHLSDVHFDTRQYNYIVWDTPQTLRMLLKARIGAVIGDGPLLLR
jgi:nucleoside 2-deoxyribosyltransferase